MRSPTQRDKFCNGYEYILRQSRLEPKRAHEMVELEKCFDRYETARASYLDWLEVDNYLAKSGRYLEFAQVGNAYWYLTKKGDYVRVELIERSV